MWIGSDYDEADIGSFFISRKKGRIVSVDYLIVIHEGL